MDQLPQDSAMLLCYINMKLRDSYPQGLDALCDDLNINRDELVKKLADAGLEYCAEHNRFW